jgi:hypothetical protein
MTLARQQGRCRCHHGGGGRPGLPGRARRRSTGKKTRSGRKNKIWHCLAIRVHSAARKDHCAGAALFGRLQWSIKRDLHPAWPCLSLSRLVCIDMGLDYRAKRGSWSFGGKSNRRRWLSTSHALSLVHAYHSSHHFSCGYGSIRRIRPID